ncbi:MAG TPA: CaiB/BaiF CoA-transferase family protein [Burkholderiaceae bacterium]|jgi:crotonobetainyl-CoA:carnitine CoA-transferase CaiB-like acyl-CoA transferase|nr:CaiB/BaiF CoA-transferase family protein [Burkholderiaceae bacterium]
MQKAFAGLRVLDFSTTIAGPHCTRLLADMGAEVIKIESPEGDMMRTRPPLRNGASTAFGQLNAGKKSVVLDLKTAAAQAAIREMVKTADILVENFRPGVMTRLKLDYAALAPLNPRLIYCAISGYGQTGPSSQLPAYAPVVHAASGYDMAHLRYQEGRTRPDYCGVFFADVGSGAYAFGAIATALHQRHATGRGQLVDVSMLETMMGFTLSELQAAQFEVPPMGRPMFGPMQCADGYVMVAVASEKTFQNLCVAAGHPEWIENPLFKKYMDRRVHWGAFMDLAEEWSRELTVEQCQAAFDREGVPCSPYRTVAEAMADPQIAHRRALTEVRDAGGTFKALDAPFRLSDADTHVVGFCDSLGEHTQAVLREAGLTDDQIAAATGAK